MMIRHSDHYHKMTIEPIGVMEERMVPDNHLTNGPYHIERLNLSIAIKHIMRAGKKEGQPWEKDIQKAQNYLHRALTGEWLPAQEFGGNRDTDG